MNYDMGELNLSPSASSPVVFVSQNDNDYTMSFTLVKDDSPYTPASGTSATISGRKPDNTVYSYTATLSGSKITFTITSQMTAVYGRCSCEISLKRGTATVGTVNIIMYVEPSPLSSTNNPSRNDLPTISEMSKYAQEAAASAKSAKDIANLKAFTGATSTTAGAWGLVPAPAAGENGYVLMGDGTWKDKNLSSFVGASSSTVGKTGLVPAPSSGQNNYILMGDGTWKDINSTVSMSVNNKNETLNVSVSANVETTITSIDLTPGKYILLSCISIKDMESGGQAVVRYSTISGTPQEILSTTRQSVYSNGTYTGPSSALHSEIFTMVRCTSNVTMAIKIMANKACRVTGCSIGSFGIF